MTNQPYDIARYKFVTATFDWIGMNLALVAWSGTPDFVPTDQHVDDIVARGNAVARGVSLPITQKTVAADGTTQTNQVVIPGVGVGAPITHFTLVDDQVGGDTLLYFVDTALDLPFDPNGLDMVIQPDWLSMRGWFRA